MKKFKYHKEGTHSQRGLSDDFLEISCVIEPIKDAYYWAIVDEKWGGMYCDGRVRLISQAKTQANIWLNKHIADKGS